MTVEAIKEEISQLSDLERRDVLNWLQELEEQLLWDRQIERDFSSGGPGMRLLHQAEEDFRAGRTKPLSELLDEPEQSTPNPL